MLRRVVGDSMLPVLSDGQVVFGLKLKKPSLNSIVIVKRKDREIIKRVTKMDGDKLYILGENLPHSTDSREFGWITLKDILATVIWPTNL